MSNRSPASIGALVDWLDVASLLPKHYRRYTPVIIQALVFFLQQLDPRRRAEIVHEQLSLGLDSSPEERLVALLRRCPTLHKLGQIVARDQRLTLQLRRRLQSLESLPPSMLIAEISPLLRRELGDDLLAAVELEEQPLAEASVAIVTPFRYFEAETGQIAEGVFKVLKPDIESALGEELILWTKLGALLDETCELHGLPSLDYQETLESVVTLLRQEVRLDAEQHHLRDARTRYANSADVRVPRLLSPCTTRVTAMERMHGRKVTEDTGVSGRRRQLGTVLLKELLARPFWDGAPVAVFHGDPHAGNLLADQKGRIALLDWSLTARLEKRERVEIVQIVLGALALDAVRIRRALTGLSNKPCVESALVPIVDQALRRVRGGEVPGLSWLIGLLDQCLLSGGLSFPPHLTIFRKALLTLSGVLADLSAERSCDPILFVSGFRQFLGEGLSRASEPMSSRAHGTHLSNADLLGLWAGLPLTASNFWLYGCLDALELVAPKDKARSA